MKRKAQLTVILSVFMFALVACGGGDEATPIAPELTPEVTPEITPEVTQEVSLAPDFTTTEFYIY